VRTTDLEPVRHIAARLPDRRLSGLDVGAGTGSYTEQLGLHLAGRASILALDFSDPMLRVLRRHEAAGVGAAVCCEAERLPIRDRSVDFVTTFNAVHHFDLDRFVDEAARVLTADGQLFVYTRTPEQNAQSIWGQAFPGFASRETRLFDTATLRRALNPLGTVDIRSFDFARLETPATLAERVRSRAYSTFALYDRDELEVALEEFLESIPSHAVRWQDQNLLVHARRGG
jgi:SAM-dependent methyltransferase